MAGLAPLLEAAPPIPAHALAALAAVGLGAAQLALPKGTRRHRLMGYAWVALLAGVAASGLFIHQMRQVGPFSWIHLLSVFTLVMLWRAVAAARRGDIREHRAAMVQLFLFALILTGLFTLLPGRVMHAVVFG